MKLHNDTNRNHDPGIKGVHMLNHHTAFLELPSHRSSSDIRSTIRELTGYRISTLYLSNAQIMSHADSQVFLPEMSKEFLALFIICGSLLPVDVIRHLVMFGASLWFNFDLLYLRSTNRPLDILQLGHFFREYHSCGIPFHTTMSVHGYKSYKPQLIIDMFQSHDLPLPQWLEVDPVGKMIRQSIMVAQPEYIQIYQYWHALENGSMQ